MSLSDLASIGSFVSGAAVLISLIFLYFQLRQVTQQVKQTEKNQQAAIRQNRTARAVDMNMGLTESSVAEAFAKGVAGIEEITSTQLAQFTYGCRTFFYNSEDSFYQHKDGLMNEVAFRIVVKNLTANLTQPGMRVAWKRSRAIYGIEFAEFMDKLLDETQAAPFVDRLAQWKADVAAEKAMTV